MEKLHQVIPLPLHGRGPKTSKRGTSTAPRRGGLCMQSNAPQNPCQQCEECWYVDKVPSNKGYFDIVSIHAFSGCHQGPGVEVKIDMRSMQGQWKKYARWEQTVGFSKTATLEKVVDFNEMTLLKFIQGLKECDLLSWGERYELDEGEGTEWVVRIRFDDSRIKKSGQNSYPRRWGSFCQLLNKWLEVEFV
ncbi:MAG: hypothetical protein ACOX0F_04565 [Syntrophomonadaceae bacterium]